MKPQLVLVAGYAGSGKTEFAKLLASRTGWALLDKDTLTRPLVEAAAGLCCGDPHDRHSTTYSVRVRPLEYTCLLATTWEVLDYGCSAIAAAPFLEEVISSDWMGNLTWRCDVQGIGLTVAWIHADLPSMRQRLTRRGAERDGWKLRCWDTYAAQVDLRLHPAVPHVVIDNSAESLSTLAEEADLLADRLIVP